jgi:hypothetical protein
MVAFWPPSMLELECLVSGLPITLRIQLTNGESITVVGVDESWTVESIMTHIREYHLKNESETETFWLFREHGVGSDPETLDFPLSKDKRLLKLMYQTERH